MLPKQLLTKKLLIISVACAALIVLAIVCYFVKPHLNIPENRTLEKTSLSIAPIQNPKSSLQYFQFVLPDSKRNIIQCDKYADYELGYSCYQQLALLRKDASYCNNIESNIETGLTHRDDCYDQVARATKSVDLCGDNTACIAIIKQDVSICPPLGDKYNGSYSCYIDVAVAKKDLSVCDLFGSDKNSKSDCYEAVAQAKQDPSICESGSFTSDQKNVCYGELSLIQNQNEDLCDKIANEQLKNSCKNRIMFQAAVQDNNIEICNSFPNQDSRNSCFWKVAYGQNNPSLCELIKNSPYPNDDLPQSQCVLQSSPAITNPSICDSLKNTHYDQSDRDLCYFQYATVNQKPESCKKIDDSSSKEQCLKEITI